MDAMPSLSSRGPTPLPPSAPAPVAVIEGIYDQRKAHQAQRWARNQRKRRLGESDAARDKRREIDRAYQAKRRANEPDETRAKRLEKAALKRADESSMMRDKRLERQKEYDEKRRRSTPGSRTRRRPQSGYYGVHANRNKWQARLHHDGKKHNIGSFNTKVEAALAYDKATREHKGSAAVCNWDSPEEGQAALAAQRNREMQHPEIGGDFMDLTLAQPAPQGPDNFTVTRQFPGEDAWLNDLLAAPAGTPQEEPDAWVDSFLDNVDARPPSPQYISEPPPARVSSPPAATDWPSWLAR